MNLPEKSKILVLTSECDLSQIDSGFEGRLVDKGKSLRSMRDLLTAVLESYCREHEVKPTELKYELVDRVQDGQLGVSLYVSTKYLAQPDLHKMNGSLQNELASLLSKSVEFKNYELESWIHGVSSNSSLKDGDGVNDRAVVDCAIRLSSFSNDLPANIAVSGADQGSGDFEVFSFSLRPTVNPIKTLPFSITGQIICVLMGYSYESRTLILNNEKRSLEVTCNIDDIDAIRHLVDGRSWREIILQGMSSRADTEILCADNLSYLSVLKERCYVSGREIANLPNQK